MTTNKLLENMMTGNPNADVRIRAAYELGCSASEDKLKGIKMNLKVEITRQLLHSLMCTQGIDLKAAMIALRIPKAERKTYEKIFAAKARQKQAR